jgi:phenylacetate-coenzyme A ligase PaaK-like adenylate-forming protein
VERKFWNDVEGWSREQIKGDQLTKLKEQVRYLNENSTYYGRIFKANGIAPEMFKSLDDLKRIPCIDKHIIGESEDRLLVPLHVGSVQTTQRGCQTPHAPGSPRQYSCNPLLSFESIKTSPLLSL